MHQPDVLLLVKDCLSLSCESSVLYKVCLKKTCHVLSCRKMLCILLPPALFVDVEADFHARVPVVICKDKDRLGTVYGLCIKLIKYRNYHVLKRRL